MRHHIVGRSLLSSGPQPHLGRPATSSSRKRTIRASAQPAGPTFWAALFGIALDQSPWQYMLRMREQGYGGVTKVPLGPFGGDFYFLLEPEALKKVLLEDAEEYFPRRYSVPLFDVLQLNRGIVYEQGQRHRRQKRLCIPSFEQSRSMNTFLTAVQEETAVLSEDWRARSAGPLRLDLYREMRQLTLSVILRVTFGLGEAGREFKDARRLSETIGQYLEAIVATANEIPPLWQISPALSTNYKRVVDELLPSLRALVAAVIAERRQAGEVGQSDDRADLLSLLVNEGSLSDEDIRFALLHVTRTPWGRRTSVLRARTGLGRTDVPAAQGRLPSGLATVRARASAVPHAQRTTHAQVLFDLVIAGSDTTASTITAALFLLHEPRHAAQLRDARAEAEAVDVLALSLEEMRERLPAARQAMRRDPASWGADADAFRPERWLASPATGGAPSTLCWLPFGAGPRGCLGTRLGITEVVISTALLLQRFDFAFDGASEGLRYKYDLTLNLEGTTLCDATPR